MEKLTYELLESKGIDTSMIKSCSKIRALAKLDRVTLDTSTHRSGLNKHLFDYIEYCGLDTLTFIKSYLSKNAVNENLREIHRMVETVKKDQKVAKMWMKIVDDLFRQADEIAKLEDRNAKLEDQNTKLEDEIQRLREELNQRNGQKDIV